MLIQIEYCGVYSFEYQQIDVYSKHCSNWYSAHFVSGISLLSLLSLLRHKWNDLVWFFLEYSLRYMKGSHLHQCYVNPIWFVGSRAERHTNTDRMEKKRARNTKITHFYWHKNPVVFIEDDAYLLTILSSVKQICFNTFHIGPICSGNFVSFGLIVLLPAIRKL